MELMVIKVCGIPDVDIGDRMLDQLKIHFQRRSNSGADVLTVLPAPTPDQAYVVFETEEVPGVLQFNHVLEVDQRFYPIQVQRAHKSEVDMTVETQLNLRLFSKPQDVRLRLESNGFKITKISPDILNLKGSFLSLMLSRKQLAQLQVQDIPPKRTSSPALFNGYSCASASQMEPNHLKTAYKASSNHGNVISNGVHSGSRKPTVDGASPLLAVSPASLNLTQFLSPEYGDPGSTGSPRSLPTYSDYSSHSRPPSSKRNDASLLVDKDVLDYAFKYEEDVFKDIERVCEVRIKDDKEVTTVIFFGENCEQAKRKLRACIEKIAPLLRTQEIDLNNYNVNQQVMIRQRIQLYADKTSDVLIKQDGETVKLVGSSKTSFEMKQKLLGLSAGPSTPSERGRTLERNSIQRSSSLPRQYKQKDWAADQGRNAEPKYAGAPSDKEPQFNIEQGRPGKPQSRIRSSSESRDKSKASRPKPKQLEEVPLPLSDGEKKSTNNLFPGIKKSLGFQSVKLRPRKKKEIS